MMNFLAQHYLHIKYLHVACVIFSLSFFVLRSLWAFLQSHLLQQRWVKILPHCVDTVLLLSAIALAGVYTQWQFLPAWITAKIIGLVCYVFFGIMLFRKAKNQQQRAIYFALATISFSYIVAVAMSKQAFFLL